MLQILRNTVERKCSQCISKTQLWGKILNTKNNNKKKKLIH